MGCDESNTKMEIYTLNQKKISQISNLILHLKEQEKEQIKPKASRRKEIIETRREKDM